ncbi:putative COPII coat assembly protein sec-16 [Podospora australis]|uniref:Protein transport protein sec16 n=1 Tax=Podospora australis TaxID=1536484 RepID=A0AAN6X0G7_9PEZI|nr:putative COPII coat assembly protein sec-16 [Podospora australis]
MFSDAPSASWHPAMMPNSSADLPPQSLPAQVTSSASPKPNPVRDDDLGISEQEGGGFTIDRYGAEYVHDKNSGPDGWFPDYGTSSSWTPEVKKEDVPEPAPEPEAASPVEHPEHSGQPDPVAPAVPTEDTHQEDQNESNTASKHLSTMSFARTVSSEITWNDDDDDAEWGLPPADPDPFKFLPDSGRTNSFPIPAPLEPEAPPVVEQPRPSNEAEDLIREIEREEDNEKAANGFEDGFGDEHGTQYAGGNLGGTAEEALEARFDEGLPLIPSAEQTAPQQGDVEGGQSGHDLFGADAAGEEDDFFSQVQNNEAVQQDDFQPQPLERKSTMDVLNSLDVGAHKSGFVSLEETLEEAEPEAEATHQQQQDVHEAEGETSAVAQDEPKAEKTEDLDAKWKEMFGDEEEEEFLADEETTPKEIDAAAFLPSDDESLLDDDTETEAPVSSGYQPTPITTAPAANGQYLPAAQTPTVSAYTPAPAVSPYVPTGSSITPTPGNPYLPPAPALTTLPPAVAPYAVPATSAPPAPPPYGYGARPAPLQEKTKAQSFVDKAKGGYTSPYDLPMEVVKPKRRAQPLRNTSAPIPPAQVMPPPPRSASLQSHSFPPPPVSAAAPPPASSSRPGSSQAAQAHPPASKPSHEGFFEDLPVVTKPRPASRNKSLPSPSQPSPYGPPPPHSAPAYPVPPPMTHQVAPPPAPLAAVTGETHPEIPALVAPPRVNPYAALPSNGGLVPAPAATTSARYSPAPPGAPPAAGAPPPALSRYSPAPPSRQPSGAYAPNPTASAPPILPHQPRTSSPLAHFEITHERSRAHASPMSQVEGSGAEKRSVSSLYDSRLQRVPSLPPTREVEEEDAPSQIVPSPRQGMLSPPMSPPESRYAPSMSMRQTPPPLHPGQSVLSPPKRAMSSHSPLGPSPEFAPPPRSQTQSPGALYGNRIAKPVEPPIPRPSSVQDLTSPKAPTGYMPLGTAAPAPATTASRSRGFSLNMNVIPPTDGREHDPLQRWRGAPLISWGVGGMMVTMFPKEVPRYGMNSNMPAVVRSPGEVKVKNAKDIVPLEERLAKFPGPLKGKSKKKEAVSWLSAGIETLERAVPNNMGMHSCLSHDDKRTVERLLLWKILRVFVENDGVLEGNPVVEKAVRELLSPPAPTDAAVPYMNGLGGMGVSDSPVTSMRSDAVDSSTIEKIRQHLLGGESEKAVWAAADQRLWGHALLLSNALAPNLYKQVAHEFIKKEVNYSGHNNESLAALYEVLSGNHEETVDELVPAHARAGFQLVAKEPGVAPSKDAMEGLDKWRETLSLILSNRSTGDAQAINSLGTLLSGYGRAEAAHICFLFARNNTIFGGLDDPNSNFVLVGSDHKRQAEQFAKEIEPLLLSEVYEYGQSLAGGSNVAVTNPHLAAYKLQHAYALAEYGFRDKALQYCEAIATAITAQTKRSPYHHHILENAVEDLMKRLRSAPKEESSSWIPKPSMNKVSDSMWNRFNKFVAGDDNEASGQGSTGDNAESGPFARMAGGTPSISRSPSSSNLETFGAAVPSYGMPTAPVSNGPVAASAPPTRAASRYAPGAAQPAAGSNNPYAPRSSMERTSSELNRGSFEYSRRSLDLQAGNAGTYSPGRSASPAQPYTPYSAGFSSSQESPRHPPPQQQPPQPSATTPGYQPYGYPGAPTNGTAPDAGSTTPAADSQGFKPSNQAPETSGYQPPSYGYEPPSFTPYEAPAQEEKKVASDEATGNSSFEPPSYQPYGYEPPSYEPDSTPADDNGDSSDEKPKPKKKGIMYDDEDDFPIPKPATKAADKSKEEKDRENAEMFRKAVEEDAKRAEAAKQAKKGWGFTSWFGGKKDTMPTDSNASGTPNKPIRAKLGEANSFHYDPELKRWVNKNGNPDDNVKKATPPPPKSAPRSASSSPSFPPSSLGQGPDGRASAPPAGPPRVASTSGGGLSPGLSPAGSPGLGPSGSGAPPPPGPVAMLRSASNTSTASAPPASRPTTSLSTSSSIDDLLGAAGPRRPGAKKPRKSARYVDVMTK